MSTLRSLGMISSLMLVLARRFLGTGNTIDRLDAFIGRLHVHQVVDLRDVPRIFLTTWLAGHHRFLNFEL